MPKYKAAGIKPGHAIFRNVMSNKNILTVSMPAVDVERCRLAAMVAGLSVSAWAKRALLASINVRKELAEVFEQPSNAAGATPEADRKPSKASSSNLCGRCFRIGKASCPECVGRQPRQK